jgi:1,4-dihydroxy-6-naphthoate synthase
MTHFSNKATHLRPAQTLSLGISPCPNDTFIFEELLTSKVRAAKDYNVQLDFVLEDVQTLNEKVIAGAYDVAKVSAGVLPLLTDYVVLSCGGAMGYGCGPLLLSTHGFDPSQTVFLPGKHTTAALLFSFFSTQCKQYTQASITPVVDYLLFDELYKKLVSNHIHQGVVIHENRFTYSKDGLQLEQDLGAFWERETGLPIPLGVIVIRKSLGGVLARQMTTLIRTSLQQAWQRPHLITDFIRHHAQMQEDAIITQHIKMFVNDFSMNMGEQGTQALQMIYKHIPTTGLANPNAHLVKNSVLPLASDFFS